MDDATAELAPIVEERRWSWRLIGWVAVLVLANRMADTAMTTPQMVTFEMLPGEPKELLVVGSLEPMPARAVDRAHGDSSCSMVDRRRRGRLRPRGRWQR